MSLFSDITSRTQAGPNDKRNGTRARRKRLNDPRRRLELEVERLEQRELLSGGITATFSGPASVTEGIATAKVVFTNVSGGGNGGGGYKYSYDFNNNGTFEIVNSSSAGVVVPESYLDDGPAIRVIHGRVSRGGNSADFYTSISVLDATPTTTITLPSAVDAGLATAFKASATSPSVTDMHAGFTYAWNFGDGSTGSGASLSHTYTTAGTYTVTLSVTDADGGAVSKITKSLTVKPVPTATFSGPTSVSEGTTNATVAFTGATGGNGTYTYSYDFSNSGTFEITGSTSASAVIPESYLDDGPATLVVHGRITDSLGGYSDYTTTITVNDVAPTPHIGLPAGADATLAATFTASATSPSTADTNGGFTYAWNFGDGSTAGGASVSHSYATAGTYTITLTATDIDGAVGTTTASFAVAPLPTATFADPSVPEGSTTETLNFINPTGGNPGYTYSYDFNNDGVFEVTSSSASAVIPESYVDDGPATVVMHGRISDKLGGYTDYTTTIVVTDVAPTPAITSPSAIDATVAATFKGSATSPSTADTAAGFTYTWNFGDGTTGTGASISHTFAAAGTYTVTLSATDADGGTVTGTTTTSVTVAALPNATFGGPSSVNEGTTTAMVSFSNPAGGSGGYTYSYDFNNSGSFEITGSSSASAAIPESYVDDGPATLVVHGRITDSLGGYTDYTTSIAINDVAPTPSISGPSSGTVGSALGFTGSATSPSTADVHAGFSYSWNFGDGMSGTGASVSHTYLAAGTYTVTLSAADADGGSFAGTFSTSVTVTNGNSNGSGENHNPFITTPWDNIPNFGQNPNIFSVHSGNWSDPSTWSLGRVPTSGDVVSIDGNTTVRYDTVNTAAINTVVIQSGGSLNFRTDISTELMVVNLLVLEGGTLQIGTVTNPVAANVTAQVVFANQALNTTLDPQQYGNGLIGLGTVTMAGAPMSDTFVPLATEPKAGDTTLTLATAVTGWQVGDNVTIPDTHQLNYTERGSNLSNYVSQQETIAIAAISADGKVLTLASPLQYDHRGARDGNGVLDFLPHVADLSRNVRIHSQSATGVRGYVMFTDRANVDVRDVGFYGLGRTTINMYDDTTFDSNGNVTHIGTNQQDRTPVSFHDLMGPATAPADGYQYTFIGNAVFCPLEPMTFRWGITIDNSHYGLIQDNVVDNWAGAGIMTEVGNESYNVIDHNFVIDVTGVGGRSADDFQAGGNATGAYGRDGVGFWISGPNNYVRNNVATDVYAVTYSYGFNLSFYQLGNINVPSFQGADTSVAGQYSVVDGNAMPLLEFSGNTAYGALQNGMTAWWVGGTDAGPATTAQSVIKNFTVWNAYQFGYYGYATNNLTLDSFTQFGDFGLLGQGNGTAVGLYFSDYITINMIVTNANIQGVQTGVGTPTKTNGTTFTIQNSYLRDQIDLAIGTMWSVSADPTSLTSRKVVVNNVHFAAAPGFVLTAIDMQYSGISQGGANLIQTDQVFVYNFNGVSGDNFQVYYTQQAASFVIPQTGQYPAGYIVGAPSSGLTNQQAWAQLSIAIAGAVAPSSATTMSGIDGLINPI